MREQEETEPKEPEKAEDQDLESLPQELEKVRQEKDEVFARLQRVYADFANFQKRVPKNINDAVTYEKEKIIRSLLPVLDNFERTLKAGSTESVEAVLKGVEIIYHQMTDILKSHGVEPIEAVGEGFDPSVHEAMMRRHEPDQPDGAVLEEFQKGYRLNERVLRPSRVAVNKIDGGRPSPAEAPDRGTDASQAASPPDNSEE